MSNDNQRNIGIPEHPRGQRMGRGEDLDAKRLEKEEGTPAISGERDQSSEMFADDSSQHFGSDSVSPAAVSPSTPAAIPIDQPLGQTGGEAQAKQRISNTGKK